VFDARRVLLYWLTQPDNDALTERELRAKAIALHAVDRGARVSSLEGTMRSHIAFAERAGIPTMTCTSFAAKGRAGAWHTETPVYGVPQCPRVCAVTTTLAYIARTEAWANRAAQSARDARHAAADPRLLPRGNAGMGVPLFVSLSPEGLDAERQRRGGPPSQQQPPAVALSVASIRRRLQELIVSFEDPAPNAHRLRHAVASTLFHVGATEQQVVAVGGWANSDTFATHYRHPLHAAVTDDEVAALWRPDLLGRPCQPLVGGWPTSWRLRAQLIQLADAAWRQRAPGVHE
jgi:hypothetical protein